MAELRVIPLPPSSGQQLEVGKNQKTAEDLKRPEMRIAMLSEHHFPQMAGIVRQEIDAGRNGGSTSRTTAKSPAGSHTSR